MCGTWTRVPLTGSPPSGPIRGAPWCVPLIVEREATTSPSPISSWLVEFWRDAFPRTAPVFRIIREAAAADPEVAALERSRAAQRLSNYRHAAKLLGERNALRSDLSIERAAASIFAIGNSDAYRALVLDGDWNDDEWAHWARETLQNALLKS